MAQEFAAAFYNSKAWHDCRRGFISHRIGIDGGMCQRCHNKLGKIVHHRIHLTPDVITNPYVALAYQNLEYLCQDCHNIEHGNKAPADGREIRFDADGNPIMIESPHEKLF